MLYALLTMQSIRYKLSYLREVGSLWVAPATAVVVPPVVAHLYSMLPRVLAVPSGIPVCIARMIGYSVQFSFPDLLLDDMLRVYIQLVYFVHVHSFIVFCYL